jgi:hypothetical protein
LVFDDVHDLVEFLDLGLGDGFGAFLVELVFE